MSKQTNQEIQNKYGEAAPLSAARTAREHRPYGDGDMPQSPGVVIPGESLTSGEFPESGESHQLVAIAGQARIISHPLPHPDAPGYAAITDYLNSSFPFITSRQSLERFFLELAEVVPQLSRVVERGKGLCGYDRSFELGEDGAKFCCVGQRDTALLMLPGKACHTIPDWSSLVELLRDRYLARITRWDGAVDDYEGVHSVDWAVEQFKCGNFTNGGNKPKCRQVGNWIEPDGTGRTFYIGRRENGKMLRVYEKGMQCGEPFHPWVRWELELHNVDRVVPWEVLFNPGKYVAGGYPKALFWVQDEMSRIKTIRCESELAYEHLVGCASTAYGRLVNVMLEVEDSPERVVELLRKDGLPKRLQMPIVPEGVK